MAKEPTETHTRVDRRAPTEPPQEAPSESAAEASAETDGDTPKRIGIYPILGRLGEGGMGQVYLARDQRLGRQVAIKILAPGMEARPEWMERFRREARTLATLNHPNIVTIYSIERDPRAHFLTMELVDGETLTDRIPTGGLPIEEILRIGSSMADALAAAHARGITHRDLKPGNVMLDREGRVKVLDFGIAKLDSAEPAETEPLTRGDQTLGTLAYMAPEQLLHQPSDARSDLFALGVILYEMATGKHPFPAPTPYIRAALILEKKTPRADRKRPDLPPRLTEIIAHCMEKDPRDRLSSATQLREALDALRAEMRDTQMLGPARARARRGLAAAAAIAALGLGSAAFWVLRQPPPGVAETAESKEIVAVLAFENLNGREEYDWLVGGIPEMLNTDFSQWTDLRALGTAALEKIYSEADLPPDAPTGERLQAVAELGKATAALHGNYAVVGETWQIGFTLEDPRSGRVLLAQRAEGRGEASLFDLIDQISTAVREHYDLDRPSGGPATLVAGSSSSLDAWQVFAEALESERRGDREGAVERFERAIEIDPDFGLAHANLGLVLQSLGRVDAASRATRRAFELRDNLPFLTSVTVEANFYGTVWSKTGRAIDAYSKGLAVFWDNQSWRNNLARRYAFFERYREALDLFDALIEEKTEFWGTYNSAATCHAALGDFETGRRILEDFAARDGDNWLAHYSLAWHLTEQGLPDEAAAAFDRAAQLRPDSHFLDYGRWRLAVLREDWPAAERHAERLKGFDDDFAHWRGAVSLARNALYRDDPAEALRHFDAAIDAASGADRALVRTFKAELLLALGNAKAALAEAERASLEGVDQFPELLGLQWAALAEEALGRSKAADARVESLRRHWLSQPNKVQERRLDYLTGRLELARGHLDAAAEHLTKAAKLLPARGVELHWHVFPDHVPVWTSLGEAELAAGHPQRALPWLERATEAGAEHLEQPIEWKRAFALLERARRELAAPQPPPLGVD